MLLQILTCFIALHGIEKTVCPLQKIPLIRAPFWERKTSGFFMWRPSSLLWNKRSVFFMKNLWTALSSVREDYISSLKKDHLVFFERRILAKEGQIFFPCLLWKVNLVFTKTTICPSTDNNMTNFERKSSNLLWERTLCSYMKTASGLSLRDHLVFREKTFCPSIRVF